MPAPVPALVAELNPCLSLFTKLLGEAGNALGFNDYVKQFGQNFVT